MRTTRLVGAMAATAAAALLSAPPAAAAAPTKFTFSTSGVSADAVFTDAPADSLVPGRTYTDVFVYAADQATEADGTRHEEDFVFVEAFSYKIDRRGNYISVSSSFGSAGGDQVTFSGDSKQLDSAALTARVEMQRCNERSCTPVGTSDVQVTWTGTGPTSTFKSSYRTSSPGQFTSTGKFSGTWREATASGTVPVVGTANAIYGSISSGTYTERTICHAC